MPRFGQTHAIGRFPENTPYRRRDFEPKMLHPPLTMSFMIPTWRSFQTLSSDAEAASVSASCIFSLATLEVASVPCAPRFALTERRDPHLWRWAIISADGSILSEGFEPNQAYARTVAGDALETAIG